MSKVKPLLPVPVAAAGRTLEESDVRHPRDINMEAIAAKNGAMIVYGPVATARGTIVRTEKRAVIWVDEKAKGEPRADFTGAHELAHHKLHAIIDHFRQCHGQGHDDDAPPRGSLAAYEKREAEKRVRLVEREANHFAAELLMPARWAAALCNQISPTLDDVHRLRRAFRTSFEASAYRFLELTAAPCAFVHTVGGFIKRSTETEAFPGAIIRERAVHQHTLAARLQNSRAGAGGDSAPREVPAAAWGDVGGAGFLEQTIALGPELGVFSWVVALG